MNLLILLLTSCAPQDAEITGTYHAWLAKNSSATVYERNLELDGSIIMDCRQVDDAELEPSSVCAWGDTPNPVDSDYTRPDNPEFSWLRNDIFYVKQGPVEAHRTEALITSEGDFQLTVHHDLGQGELLRYVFVIDPHFRPSVCAPSGATCFSDGELTDDDGDGWADYEDPDCLDGSFETGFTNVACNDGLDNDGDGAIDRDDPDCTHALGSSEGVGNCDDGDDNDSDGWTDSDDPDCLIFGEETGETNSLYACNDGLDNDGDGDVDGDDAECELAFDNDEDGFTSDEPCDDNFDNDGDGWADGDDPDCGAFDDEVSFGATACNDGLDNDGDGNTDADDDGCVTAGDADEGDLDDSTCVDGDDNDGDGWIDGGDPDCLFGGAEDASYTASQCADGVDNDGDGDIDGEDGQCVSGFDNAEENIGSGTCRDGANADDDGDGWGNDLDPDCGAGSSEIGFSARPCNDGIDNDGDALVDALDLGCLSPLRVSEELDLTSDCLDTLDNDGDGLTDADDPGCILGDFEDAVAVAECADGVDNDGDGFTDADDEDCSWSGDNQEVSTSSCADGQDNDGDGWVDVSDPDCGSLGYERGFSEVRCDDGIDNDGDGLADGFDDGCSNPADPFEVVDDECADGIDNDGDTWVDSNDLDCMLRDEPFEDGTIVGLTQCSDGQDNDGDGLTDGQDSDCPSALDNIEATPVFGEPTDFEIDYSDTLTEWASDEDGSKIYYLNAGAYQENPSDSEDLWVLPQEWLAGYSTAKFAAEEFDVLPNQFYYLGFSVEDPPTSEEYADAVAEFETAAALWSAEPATYGFAQLDPSVPPYEIKVEGNGWRPLDRSEAGLDNWVEMHTSWVRIDADAEFVKGASFSGDYQIYMTGRDAASQLMLKGSFTVNNIREDIWGYSVLEDDLNAQHTEDGLEVSACE